MSNSPTVIVVRYDAIGSLAFQFQVVQPCLVELPVSTPLAIASRPAGTVIANVYDAVSSGWSFTGYHVLATRGWPATNVPSSVWRKPLVPSTSTMGSGTPS